MFGLVLAFILVNCACFLARYTSRVIERYARSGYWYMRKKTHRDRCADDAALKVLPRERMGYREMLADYLTELESDAYDKTRWEMVVWDWYCTNVSEEGRARDRPDGLPAWAERVAGAYNNFYIYNGVLFCVFFTLSLVSASLWMPLLGMDGGAYTVVYNASETRRLAVSELAGRELYTCDSALAGDYCFLEEEDMNITLGLYVHDAPPSRAVHDTAAWVDRRGAPHYYTNTARGVHFVSDGALQRALQQLHRDEAARGLGDTPCVCGAFMGLRDNVTLAYEGGAWVVMWRPVIQRANALSTEVRSTVRYHFNSNLFAAHQHLQQQLQLGDVVHHDAFVVEYDAVASAEVSDALHGMAYQLRVLEPRPLLFQRATLKRQRMQMRGNDAICYVYCDRMNGKLAQRAPEN